MVERGVGNKVVLKERGMEYSFNHIFSLEIEQFLCKNHLLYDKSP